MGIGEIRTRGAAVDADTGHVCVVGLTLDGDVATTGVNRVLSGRRTNSDTAVASALAPEDSAVGQAVAVGILTTGNGDVSATGAVLAGGGICESWVVAVVGV